MLVPSANWGTFEKLVVTIFNSLYKGTQIYISIEFLCDESVLKYQIVNNWHTLFIHLNNVHGALNNHRKIQYRLSLVLIYWCTVTLSGNQGSDTSYILMTSYVYIHAFHNRHQEVSEYFWIFCCKLVFWSLPKFVFSEKCQILVCSNVFQYYSTKSLKMCIICWLTAHCTLLFCLSS